MGARIRSHRRDGLNRDASSHGCAFRIGLVRHGLVPLSSSPRGSGRFPSSPCRCTANLTDRTLRDISRPHPSRPPFLSAEGPIAHIAIVGRRPGAQHGRTCEVMPPSLGTGHDKVVGPAAHRHLRRSMQSATDTKRALQEPHGFSAFRQHHSPPGTQCLIGEDNRLTV